MKKIIYIIGKPGSGKGTTAQYLKCKYNFDHIIASKILFKYLHKTYGKDSEEVKRVLEGQIIKYYPIFDNLIIEALLESKSDMIVLDGYPRIIKQLNNHLILINANNITKRYKKYIVRLDVDTDRAWERIKNRNVCLSCNLVYTKKSTDTCNQCSEQLVERVDDNINTFNNRIRSYQETLEVFERFKEHVDKCIVIETDNKSIEFITESIMEFLKDK